MNMHVVQATVRPPVVRNFNYIVLPFTYIVGCFPWIVLALVGRYLCHQQESMMTPSTAKDVYTVSCRLTLTPNHSLPASACHHVQ